MNNEERINNIENRANILSQEVKNVKIDIIIFLIVLMI